MSDPFVAEIELFAGSYAPSGYALCNGQLIPIRQNTALFALLGVTYGGDGVSTCTLPDMRSRSPMHWGSGPGLTPRSLGESGGAPTVTLLTSQMPAHNHSLNCNDAGDGGSNPQNATFTGAERGRENAYATQPATVNMNVQTVGPVGGNQGHNNRQPYLGLTFIIALVGVFPQRS